MDNLARRGEKTGKMLGKKKTTLAFLHFCFSLSGNNMSHECNHPKTCGKNLERLTAACPGCGSTVRTGAERNH